MNQRDRGRSRQDSLTAQALTTPQPHPSPSVQAWEAYVQFWPWGQKALFESRVDEIMARLLGNPRELARLVPVQVYETLRGAFASGERDPLEAILGRNDPVEGWQPGLAKLEPREARAFDLSLRYQLDGEPDLREIALHMDRKAPQQPGRRRAGSLFPGFQVAEGEGEAAAGEHMPLDTVQTFLKRARRKLRLLFGAEAPGGASQFTNSPTSQPSSTATPGTSASDTPTLRILPRTPSFATSSAPLSCAVSH